MILRPRMSKVFTLIIGKNLCQQCSGCVIEARAHYRSYGDATDCKTITEEGVVSDAMAALQWLEEGVCD